jgi:non-canonical purine NTP pyrophosphatase (RdgB/HAM1 family)
MSLYFITGNKGKFEEVKAVIPSVEQLDIDLPEVQSINSQEIIEAKLQSAFEHHEGAFIVEDNSFTLKGMNGLPGPLVKWFLKSIGNEGIVKLAELFGTEVDAKVIIGYAENLESIQYFEGSIRGTIVEPRGDKGFGWDPIFQPEGYEKTFGEMEQEEKNSFSMRRVAVEKLKEAI